MNIERFYQLLKDCPGDYLVILDVKYRFEVSFRRIFEVLGVSGSGDFMWFNDWNEGESDIFVVCYDTIENAGELLLDHYCRKIIKKGDQNNED